MKVRKAVITAAGQGTRMKHITSIIPKALLPLYAKEDGKKVMSPIIDRIIKSLKGAGVEEICIIVGKNNKPIKSYLRNEKITYAKQKGHKGFGDAVVSSEEFANNEPIILHTDDIFLTHGYDTLVKLFEHKNADAVFFIRKVDDPKRYGIVSVSNKESFMEHEVYKVTRAEEKPENPKSDLAIVGTYIFSSKIYEGLRKSYKKNHELTYGIQSLIETGGNVYGIMLKDEKRFNVGDPDNYYKALTYTYEASSN